MTTRKDYHKLVALAAVGSCFELFDFISFVFLSSILAKVFFPAQNAAQGLISTFIIFSTGYFFRPLGGIILAHFGDRYGRKKIFVLTLVLMSVPSLLISIMPTANQIGIAAPLLLGLLRVTQGLSVGGEVAGSVIYVAEFTSPKWRSLAACVMSFAANIGVLAVTLVISLLTHYLPEEQMLAYGWRIPFLIGACLGIIAFYLRKRFSETPLYKQMQAKNAVQTQPLLYVIKNYKRHIFFGVCVAIVIANATSTFHLYFPAYLTHFYHFKIEDVVLVSSAGIAVLAFSSLFFALTSMYFGKEKQCMAGSMLIFIVCMLAVQNNYECHTLQQAYLFIIAISFAISMVNAVMMAILVDLFPTSVRFTGVALTYNLGCLIGAGVTPIANSSIINLTGYLHTPFVMVACVSVSAAFAMYFSSRSIYHADAVSETL